jgi:hypothetical protein
VHGRGEGRKRRDRRAALHLRPGDARRRRPGRAPAQGDAALALGRARRLFTRPDPGADGDPFADINPASETLLDDALIEPALVELAAGETVQFERLGYFCSDPDSTPGRLVFNRTLGLKDAWARIRA